MKNFKAFLRSVASSAWQPLRTKLNLSLWTWTTIALVSVGTAELNAKEVRFNDLVIDILDAQKITVTGFKGSVKLLPSKLPGKLIVHAKKIIDDKKQASEDSWIFGAKHEEKNIKIEVRSSDPQIMRDDLKQGNTEFQFEIEAPNLPFDIAWREGQINVQNWNSALNIVLLDGILTLTHCGASTHVQNEMGELHILNHKGRVEIESLKAKLNISDFEGNLRIKNFAGESNLVNVSASIRLQSKLGASHVAKSQGNLEIENGKGNFNILDFSGPIRGQNEDGSLTARILGDVDVSLESISGSMSFKLPVNSAAFAKLQSEEGSISAPDSFKTGKLGSLKLASGRFTGSEKGSIFIKSKTGSLRVH